MHQCGFVRHSVNPSVSQLDTINMHRHQLNCISFIAKQQQLLLLFWQTTDEHQGAMRGSVGNWCEVSLHFASMRSKEKNRKQKNKHKIKQTAHTTEKQCGMRSGAKGMKWQGQGGVQECLAGSCHSVKLEKGGATHSLPSQYSSNNGSND